MQIIHLPVLLREVIDLLRPEEGGVYVDATVGPGGHSEELLRHIGSGRLVCIDRDAEALGLARKRLHDKRCVFRKAEFSEVQSVLDKLKIGPVDGVLMDLGVSMLQMKSPERGFSFDSDGPLDMRMDRDITLTASEVVNLGSEKEIERILKEYGQEWHSRKIARAITARRRKSPIETCRQLAQTVSSAVGRRGRTHPATKTFQALRIAVNDELGELQRGLGEALSVLKRPGGKMAVISYHSLEDRLVKNFMKDEARGGGLKILTKKPVVPGRTELRENPSARSAKLRAAEAM
jgi:16S rRNA (cytosine1402-N4)-methyltransferase